MNNGVKGSATTSRRERARQTRAKIIRAADEEFRAAGYQGATMAAIARRAGVAVQTIYFVFGTKAELLSDVIDAAVQEFRYDHDHADGAGWYRAMEADPDPASALRTFVRGMGAVLARVAPLKPIIDAAAAVDPEAKEVHDKHEQLRQGAYRAAAELLATKGALREDIDVDTATDILIALGGEDGYQAFRRRGWEHDRCLDYLCEILPELLIAAREDD